MMSSRYVNWVLVNVLCGDTIQRRVVLLRCCIGACQAEEYVSIYNESKVADMSWNDAILPKITALTTELQVQGGESYPNT